MKHFLSALLVLNLSAAEELPVSPRVDSVGLFKNGIAVVRASFEAGQPGSYLWEDLPRPIHGTFWVESDGALGVRTTTRRVAKTDAVPSGDLQRDLAGLPVTVRLKEAAGAGVVAGTVWSVPDPTPRVTRDANLLSADRRNPWSRATLPQPGPAASRGNFLVLETGAGGREYLDLSMVASVAVDGPVKSVGERVEIPVMVFDITEPPRDGGRVRITYLARGLAWAPSYRLDLADDGSLTIRRGAVVRNELVALDDTELQLISGFPNIGFGHVDSPLSGGATLASFFQQLGQPPGSAAPVTTQQMVMYNSMAPGPAALPDFGEAGATGDDLHHEGIGRRTLDQGDTLALDLAAATTQYQRVIEWVVADHRDAEGRYLADHQRSPADEPWDALKFTNPFEFPLTTAPVMITEGGQFRGQSQGHWVNPGQSTCLRITKALSIHARASEIEEEGERAIVWMGGNDYRQTTVKGNLELRNFRAEEVALEIRAEFSGEMIEADGQPAARLRSEGVTSVNPRRELVWSVKLGPGEKTSLSYRYSVRVRH